MILSIDIGNSNICFALHRENAAEPVFFERVRTDREKTAAQYRRCILAIFSFHGIDTKEVTGAVLSSVVPQVTEAVTEAASSVLGCSVLKIRYDLDLGFSSRVDDPSTVGTDILADIAGAITSYGAPVVTFDLGTATVCSFTDDTPALSGILIAPGVRTSLNALAGSTSMLPSVALEHTEHAIGKNTRESMQSGILYGTAGMIDRLSEEISASSGLKCKTVLTGGLSRFIKPYCKTPVILDPTLLMRGLYTIYQRNR